MNVIEINSGDVSKESYRFLQFGSITGDTPPEWWYALDTFAIAPPTKFIYGNASIPASKLLSIAK